MSLHSRVLLLHRRLGALLLLELLSVSQLSTAILLTPWGGKPGAFLDRSKRTEVNNQSISQNEGQQYQITCTPANTVFDFGFYDGADSDIYLQTGFCVVGVEADPDLVDAAKVKYQVALANGQLRLVHAAVAPSAQVQWTTFYKNKCADEWNSFFKSVGCRSCNPPYTIEASACEEVSLRAVTCGEVLQQFGVPHHFKLDIEGAETGCFEGMTTLGVSFRPQFLSAEITELSYLDSLYQLGYTKFKLMRQDKLMQNLHSRSGPWGDNAWDCRTGQVWRTYQDAHAEMSAILSKSYDMSDPCSGGVCPIHQQGCEGAAVWYDVHAMYR